MSEPTNKPDWQQSIEELRQIPGCRVRVYPVWPEFVIGPAVVLLGASRPFIEPAPFSSNGCYAALTWILFGLMTGLFLQYFAPVYLIVGAICGGLVYKLGDPVPLYQVAAHYTIGVLLYLAGEEDNWRAKAALVILTLIEAGCALKGHLPG